MYFIGIDPGLGGGLAFLSGSSMDGVSLTKMPSTERGILDWLVSRDIHTKLEGPTIAGIETIPTAIFGADKSSGAKLYGNYRALRMALVALSIPFTDVPAKKWQIGLGLKRGKRDRTSWKRLLLETAQDLFPQDKSTLRSEKITLATADALLIAEWCRRDYQGTLTNEVVSCQKRLFG